MSLDEARFNYSVDALGATNTYNYLLVGDNAYGFSFSSSDLDFYALYTDVGSSYYALSGPPIPGQAAASFTNLGLRDRFGNLIAISQPKDAGFTGLQFTAIDTKYSNDLA